jgi:hypothetical protein
MAKKNDAIYDRLIKVGLQDPFMRGIAGVVLIATAASLAISALGSGTKAVISIVLALLFGVVLVVLRALMKYADSTFVRVVCFASSAVIMTVFLVFTVLLVPAAVICWPQPYAQLLNLPNCSLAAIESATIDKPFTPVEYTGQESLTIPTTVSTSSWYSIGWSANRTPNASSARCDRRAIGVMAANPVSTKSLRPTSVQG